MEKENKKSKKNKRPLLIGLMVLSIALAIFVVGLIGIYGANSTNFIFSSMSRVIPYPAMIVNWEPVSYYEYSESINTIKRFDKLQEELSFNESEVSKNVATRLVTNKILEQIAREQDVKVFDYEIEKEFQSAVNSGEDEKEIEKNIKELFGWNIEEYKENVVRPFVLEKKLSEAIYDGDPDAPQKFAGYLQEEIANAKIIYFVPH